MRRKRRDLVHEKTRQPVGRTGCRVCQRRERDSNPRCREIRHTGLAIRRFRPLSHLSSAFFGGNPELPLSPGRHELPRRRQRFGFHPEHRPDACLETKSRSQPHTSSANRTLGQDIHLSNGRRSTVKFGTGPAATMTKYLAERNDWQAGQNRREGVEIQLGSQDLASEVKASLDRSNVRVATEELSPRTSADFEDADRAMVPPAAGVAPPATRIRRTSPLCGRS